MLGPGQREERGEEQRIRSGYIISHWYFEIDVDIQMLWP